MTAIRFFREHPQDRHYNARLVAFALAKVFRCPGK
jgi:hypothetical protein